MQIHNKESEKTKHISPSSVQTSAQEPVLKSHRENTVIKNIEVKKVEPVADKKPLDFFDMRAKPVANQAQAK